MKKKQKAITLEELKLRKPMKPGYADGLCGAVLPSYRERQKLVEEQKKEHKENPPTNR